MLPEIQNEARKNISLLTKQDILDIRNKYNSGISYNDLSLIYNCCTKTIWRIVHYITYKHI